jgi:hypothetical protein
MAEPKKNKNFGGNLIDEMSKMCYNYNMGILNTPISAPDEDDNRESDVEKTKPCDNPECSTSTGIDNHLTFGSGDLDEFGYWKHPCATCARDHEKKQPEMGKCWPFKNPDEDINSPTLDELWPYDKRA